MRAANVLGAAMPQYGAKPPIAMCGWVGGMGVLRAHIPRNPCAGLEAPTFLKDTDSLVVAKTTQSQVATFDDSRRHRGGLRRSGISLLRRLSVFPGNVGTSRVARTFSAPGTSKAPAALSSFGRWWISECLALLGLSRPPGISELPGISGLRWDSWFCGLPFPEGVSALSRYQRFRFCILAIICAFR